MVRSAFWKKLVDGGVAVVALAFIALSSPAASSSQLFFIERSKNANIVRFDARLTKTGALDAKQPIDAYWIMLAENGRREELNGLEKRFAYGYDVLPGATSSTARIRLAALPHRELRVRKISGGFAAELDVARTRSRLQRIYVKTKETALLPSVVYIDLHGISIQTGKRTYERLEP